MSEKKTLIKRSLLILGATLLIVGGIIFWNQYKAFLAPNVPTGLENAFVQIPTGSSFEQVVQIMVDSGFIKNEASFRQVAQRMSYVKDPMRPGRFEIKAGWNNYRLIRHLRGGPQSPVKVVINIERLPEEVAAKVARFIEADSASLFALFQDEAYLASIGYTPQTVMTLFIPNTYEFFWNTSPEKFIERMIKEHDRFWASEGRLEKAKARNMTPEQVYTLASIVEKETNQNVEKARIAGVYLNRLSINMLLQADPTCVFATRDFDTPQVLEYHYTFDSPYNTYKYTGLPPGPICISSIASIDAVLNAENHRYFYFCAVGDNSGLHNFAESYDEHLVNVRLYKNNLVKRGRG